MVNKDVYKIRSHRFLQSRQGQIIRARTEENAAMVDELV